MQLIRTGKVKEVYDTGDSLLFKFTDKISVFDKIIPTLIKGKGESLCRTSAFWFQKVSEMGFPTHFISMPEKNQMIVRKFRILETGATKFDINFLIPLEFVVRYYVAGSLMDRLKSGEIDHRILGVKNMPEYGEPLLDPYFEVTTKFEKFDRPLTAEEACDIGGIRKGELYEIRDEILSIDRMMQKEVGKRGLVHADGKKEFAMGPGRQPVIVDTFGTADEDRFWEQSALQKGEILELSKESVRQYYRSIGYHKALYEARSRGASEPDIPPLPDNVRIATEDLYRNIFERLTGMKW
ncbi:MAG: phosphoribosylaminoimidazolesuccinocarboxamide synthase [Thermoplasmata archaeon]